MSNTEASAGGLLGALKEAFNFGPKKPSEAPAVEVAPLTAAPTETPAEFTAPPEPTSTTMPQPSSTEAPTPTAVSSAPSEELPDWLRGPYYEEPVQAPLPEEQVVEAPVVEVEATAAVRAPMSAPEASSALPAVEVEKNPEQLAIEEFEEELLSADDTLTKLRAGESLDETQLRAAKAAAAKANGSVRNLPERYLKVLLASRRLGENRDYTRMDFQKDMLAAIRVFSQTKKG